MMWEQDNAITMIHYACNVISSHYYNSDILYHCYYSELLHIFYICCSFSSSDDVITM
jgi:hypothetical protein